jgi:hypothetical protein
MDTEQTTLPETETPELSLREELAKNLEAISTPEPVVEAPVTQETAEQKETRLRDEKGRFVEGKPPEKVVASPQAQPAPVAAVLPRPSSWKKDYWNKWDEIATKDPELAKYLQEREGQFASGVSTYKQEWETAKPLIDAIAPFQPILQQNGIDPAQWITNLGNAHQKLVFGNPQEKMQMFQQLMRDYNIPAQLAIQDQQGQWQLAGQTAPAQPQFDPNMVERLVEKKLSETSTKQALQAFQQEAPTKYPHFETVRQTMAGLLQAGLADDLPSAYEAALRHPRHSDLFAEMQQQQSAQAEQERKAANAQKVQRARANNISPSGSTPAGNMTAVGEKSLRDQLTENLRAVAGGRV